MILKIFSINFVTCYQDFIVVIRCSHQNIPNEVSGRKNIEIFSAYIFYRRNVLLG